MRCVVSCGSTSILWLVFFCGALLWGCMIQKHTGRWMWQGSATVVSWNWKKNTPVIPNWFQPCQCCCCLCYPGEYLRLGTPISHNWAQVLEACHCPGKEDKHEHGFGFLVHKDVMDTVMGCCPASNRLITIRLKAVPFSITSIRPNIRLWWQRNRRILWPATECHWSDTEEGHSCCTRRLEVECESGQGCLWKRARYLLTLLQWWHKWERTQTSRVCHL